jgi:ATP/maltotriose-dependent transcriptional regulator MalT
VDPGPVGTWVHANRRAVRIVAVTLASLAPVFWDRPTGKVVALRLTSVDHERVVLPSLLNDLSRVASPLVLVLDDYHLVTNPGGARALPARAHELIEHLADPRMLPTLLEQARRMPGPAPRRRVKKAAPLTERELVVLRLLPTRLSTSEMSHELHVSVNTVRSQVQAIYRKLEVTTRSEAITKARQTGLLPGSTTTDP